MPLPKYLASTTHIITIGVLILTTALASRQEGGNKQRVARQEKKLDFSRFPIADFHAPETLDANLRAAREAKGRKYNDKHMPQISDDTYQIFAGADWDVGLPALPVERSAAVVIGAVKSANAYLIPDKTGIYSEFQVAILSLRPTLKRCR